LGYNLHEFLDLTPRQFFNAVGGFVNREESKLKESWEQTRLILAEVRNKPVYGYKIRPVVAKQMMPFPWEEPDVDKDTIEKLKQHMQEHNGNKNSSESNGGN
jgi:hypothetical protein